MSEQTVINTTTTPSTDAIDAQSILQETPAIADNNLSQFQSLLEAGGPVVMILIGMSIVAVTIFLFKCWQFSWMGISRKRLINEALVAWHKGQIELAQTSLSKTKNPIARVLERCISLEQDQDVSVDTTREEVTRLAKGYLAKARSHLKFMETISTLSPLLGLLGTVLGMIEAFQKLQGAGATIDPSILSGGIWEALLTTAAGLIVAIPTVLALNWLEQRVENFKALMEDSITQIFTSEAIKSKTLSQKNPLKEQRIKTSSQSTNSRIENTDFVAAQ